MQFDRKRETRSTPSSHGLIGDSVSVCTGSVLRVTLIASDGGGTQGFTHSIAGVAFRMMAMISAILSSPTDTSSRCQRRPRRHRRRSLRKTTARSAACDQRARLLSYRILSLAIPPERLDCVKPALRCRGIGVSICTEYTQMHLCPAGSRRQ